jgi:hypothetical protein
VPLEHLPYYGSQSVRKSERACNLPKSLRRGKGCAQRIETHCGNCTCRMDRIERIAASKRANCGPKGLVLAKRMQVRGTRRREERWGPFGYASARHAQERREVGTLWVCKCRARAAIVKPLSECDFHRRERSLVPPTNYVLYQLVV